MEYRGLTLDGFQAEAIAHLAAGRSVLVCAPTGTGKTIIADWVVDDALARGREVVYTAPIKALSNQKFRDYSRLHGEEVVGLVTGDLVIRRDAPCRVMTTEILRNMLLTGDDLSRLHAVVVDEIHFLDDRERGTVWEELLIYLPKHVLVVGLSATLANRDAFASWLSAVREAPIEVLVETHRAVPLSFHLANIHTGITDPANFHKRFLEHERRAQDVPVDRRGGRDRRDRRGGRDARPDKARHVRRTRHGDIVAMLIAKDLLPCLYFAFSRRDIEANARWLVRELRDDLLTPDEERQLDARLDAAHRTLGRVLSPDLRAMYGRGIAFHHAGLHVSLKALVEELYEARLIKVLYCTSTFALGINMPARSVAFDGLKKYDGRSVAPLTVRGFMQKAGRAGRRGLDDAGHVVLRMDWEDYAELRPLLQHYFEGRPEPVRSSFSLSWNSIVRLLGSHDRDHVREIVEKSFLNWHLESQAAEHRQRAEELERDADQGRNEAEARRARKEARRLRARAASAGSRCWDEFQRKEAFLVNAGYIGRDGTFNAGARILRHLQITEILVSELVLAGVFDGLDDPTLFGLLCALVSDFPRKAERRFGLDKDLRQLANRVEAVRRSPIVVDSEVLTQMEIQWSPYWIPLGRAWVRGDAMVDVLKMVESETDIAGDIVGTFRRAKDLCKQLADVHQDHPEHAAALRDLAKRVARDEVEVVD
jgi:superfamily II RNA helicase